MSVMHFVPQSYLKGWEAPQPEHRGKIWAYRRVVPTESHPEWMPIAIRSVAALPDLYPEELDRWLKDTVEDPAGEVLMRVRAGVDPTTRDWSILSRFAVAQDLRTLKSWMGFRARAGDRVKGVIANLQKRFKNGQGYPEGSYEVDSDAALVKVDVVATPEGKAEVGVSVGIGPRHWIRHGREMVEKYATGVEKHCWQVVRAAPGLEFPTSDHPVLRLAYQSDRNFSFDGGWLQNGVDLIMPLSPDMVMFTQVGRGAIGKQEFDVPQTQAIRRFLAQNSHRSIYMRTPAKRLGWMARRRVDAALFQSEDRLRKEGDPGDPFGTGGEAL